MTCWSGTMAATLGQDSLLIHFRQSRSYLDTTYMNNAEALKRAASEIQQFNSADSNLSIAKVTVVGAASPEGSVAINQRLSHLRAKRIFDYFSDRMSLPDSLTQFTYIGRDWVGLRTMVEQDAEVPYRDEVLSMLDDIIARTAVEGETESQHNVLRLKHLRGGVPYLYMYYHLFPDLRASRLVLTFDEPSRNAFAAPVAVSYFDAPVLTPAEPVFLPMPGPKKPFYMALKTNMLYDALAVPNISAEFYLGRNFSIVGNWLYGWWDKDRVHKYWRLYGGDIALRWWFGEKAAIKPLTGHHVGIYGGVFTYDFEFGGKGYMGGLPGRPLWARCSYQGGVEYGYSLPIKKRLNIDFTIGIGYIGGQYREYIPVDRCYVWQATKQCHWFGPTKIEVSLAWLIGRGNYNVKKGGAL